MNSATELPTDVDGAPLAWSEAEMQKPWGAEAAFLRNLADHGGLAPELGMMLRHCAKGIERSTVTVPQDLLGRFQLALSTLFKGEAVADGKKEYPRYAEDLETMCEVRTLLMGASESPSSLKS